MNKIDLVGKWIEDGFCLKTEHEKIQFLSALEFLEKIDYSDIYEIADIGSGPGHQAFYFHKKGLEVTCIDYIKPVYDIPWVKPGDTKNTYDAIWSHHCLEHIQNPVQALCSWRKMLKPKGRLFLTVPEIGLVMSSGHINNFNIPLLIYFLAMAGFDCSEKCFTKSRSHLRANVRLSEFYDPNTDGVITSLSELARRGLFSPTIRQAIEKDGRFSAKDIHLDWYGVKKSPKSLSVEAYEFITSSLWS